MTTLTAPAHGSKYDAALSTAETAKRIRRDIAAAVAGGLLPAGTKASVTIRRGSYSASIRVVVTSVAGLVLSTKRVRHDIESPTVFSALPILNADGRRLVATLEAFANAYRARGGDHLYAFVSIDGSILSAQRAEIEAAIRGAQEAA